MLNLKHLYYFHIFAKELSTKRAANRLGITSPALSNQLKELESFLGVKLMRRFDGKVVFTETGEIVLHYAQRMFTTYEELMVRLSTARGIRSANFQVGICQILGVQFAFDLLSLVLKSDISLAQKASITFDSTEVLLAGFRKDQFDLILGAFAPGALSGPSGCSQAFAFPVRLFAPLSLMASIGVKNKQLADIDLAQVIELANAKQIPLVLPARPSVLRDETDQFLANSKITPVRTIECNRSSAIVQLIERGLALGFAPTPCLLDFKSAGPLAVLGPPLGYWSHEVSVLIQKDEEGSLAKVSSLENLFSPNQTFN